MYLGLYTTLLLLITLLLLHAVHGSTASAGNIKKSRRATELELAELNSRMGACSRAFQLGLIDGDYSQTPDYCSEDNYGLEFTDTTGGGGGDAGGDGMAWLENSRSGVSGGRRVGAGAGAAAGAVVGGVVALKECSRGNVNGALDADWSNVPEYCGEPYYGLDLTGADIDLYINGELRVEGVNGETGGASATGGATGDGDGMEWLETFRSGGCRGGRVGGGAVVVGAVAFVVMMRW
ncbi:uncharacterized protein H6S33_002918 [Morchella sextelata]|uniref:uncharacterized protein n=1 Tax=Morchella sextelata TaxID=1174677 RepID=UPI001D037C82|nr:uncharacterized protein H6S33_002918 [Morchella sextelata]KAH0606930.1 hypothetical protein H6S33_002918 [Morchella sextelata]